MKATLTIIMSFINFVGWSQSGNQYDHFTSTANTLILSYDDFGPQVVAHDLLGLQFWQWDSQGDPDPKTTYDIRVIVYKDISLESLKKDYPINRDQKIDFRYLSYDGSIEYLDSLIEEFGNDFDIVAYSELREKIIAYFNSQK